MGQRKDRENLMAEGKWQQEDRSEEGNEKVGDGRWEREMS